MDTLPQSGTTATDDRANTQVAVCICTYKRPAGLRRLLEALDRQQFPDLPRPTITVIVADNECSDTNRHICNALQSSELSSVVYVPVDRRGISHARNACLDALPAGTHFVAMIDDDETPGSSWLNHLLLAQQRSAADVVVGPTMPEFETETADWVAASGYFEKPWHPQQYRDLQADPPAATCNVLMKADFFNQLGLRFDPELALSGGEDKLMFQYIKKRGYKFTWAAHAGVVESIPPERATFRYMWMESLRRGSVKFYIKKALRAPGSPMSPLQASRFAARALWNILAGCFLVAGQLATSPTARDKLVIKAMRIADGIGSIAGLTGTRNRHYLANYSTMKQQKS